MVDRIDKTNPEVYRVRDALEEEKNKKDQEEEEEGEEGEGDNFDKLSNKTDWNILFDKTNLWQRNVEVKVEDIDRIKFMGINLKTDPSLLKIRLFLYDGTVIHTAFLSIARSLGLQIKNLNRSAYLNVNQLTNEPSLRLTIPVDEEKVDDEITKITGTPKEKSFSKTLKTLISKKTWMQKLGIQDPVSKVINAEILWIYITVVIVISAVSFGILFLLF